MDRGRFDVAFCLQCISPSSLCFCTKRNNYLILNPFKAQNQILLEGKTLCKRASIQSRAYSLFPKDDYSSSLQGSHFFIPAKLCPCKVDISRNSQPSVYDCAAQVTFMRSKGWFASPADLAPSLRVWNYVTVIPVLIMPLAAIPM